MSVISITDLAITDGMYQFRKEEREFLERKNDISSLLRWKSRDQEIMISYTNMEYLPLFLMFYQSLLKRKVTNFLAFVTDQLVSARNCICGTFRFTC